ncbi:MAG: FecR domain-containing protein [Fuerstiella sp.]|nr:FecR domain-containing protein [Fuerstiella sp.]
MTQINDELLDDFLDGEVSSEEATLVLAWLELPANMERYALRAGLKADLCRSLQRRKIQQNALAVCDDDSATPIRAAVGQRGRTSHRNVKLAYTFAAAALATVACLIIAFQRPGDLSDPNGASSAIATVAYQSHARWADEQRRQGDEVGTGVLQLEVGIVRLDFANGAAVTLQGPAEFEILNNDHTRLHRGILTAQVPESAIRFEVETPVVEVVDLGTAFGVSVGVDGETDVCVFQGEVEVSLAGNDRADSVQRVREGNAVRTRSLVNTIQSVAYETNRYEDAWPVTSGVMQATGLMKFVSPGPEFVPGRYEDSERILVFSERFEVLLETDLSVDLIEPGQYRRIHRAGQELISAGQRVNSYLLQLDPVGRLARDAPNKPRAIGQITFNKPIIGLIGGTKKLRETDDPLGHPQGDYGSLRRGIEPPKSADSSDAGRDVVILSGDRRTLSLDLSAGTAVDQIRVVVRASE